MIKKTWLYTAPFLLFAGSFDVRLGVRQGAVPSLRFCATSEHSSEDYARVKEVPRGSFGQWNLTQNRWDIAKIKMDGDCMEIVWDNKDMKGWDWNLLTRLGPGLAKCLAMSGSTHSKVRSDVFADSMATECPLQREGLGPAEVSRFENM